MKFQTVFALALTVVLSLAFCSCKIMMKKRLPDGSWYVFAEQKDFDARVERITKKTASDNSEAKTDAWNAFVVTMRKNHEAGMRPGISLDRTTNCYVNRKSECIYNAIDAEAEYNATYHTVIARIENNALTAKEQQSITATQEADKAATYEASVESDAAAVLQVYTDAVSKHTPPANGQPDAERAKAERYYAEIGRAYEQLQTLKETAAKAARQALAAAKQVPANAASAKLETNTAKKASEDASQSRKTLQNSAIAFIALITP